jgi:hypothetical protein
MRKVIGQRASSFCYFCRMSWVLMQTVHDVSTKQTSRVEEGRKKDRGNLQEAVCSHTDGRGQGVHTRRRDAETT